MSTSTLPLTPDRLLQLARQAENLCHRLGTWPPHILAPKDGPLPAWPCVRREEAHGRAVERRERRWAAYRAALAVEEGR